MTKQQITIRKPILSEWKEYKTLRLKATKECPFAFLSTPEEIEAENDSHWKNRIEKSKEEKTTFMLVGFIEEEMAGMMALYWEDRDKIRHVAHLVSVYIDSQTRGQGVGSKLLEAVIEKAREKKFIRKIRLSVTSVNPAKIFYEKKGFKVIGNFKEEVFVDGKYYDEDVMELEI